MKDFGFRWGWAFRGIRKREADGRGKYGFWEVFIVRLGFMLVVFYVILFL